MYIDPSEFLKKAQEAIVVRKAKEKEVFGKEVKDMTNSELAIVLYKMPFFYEEFVSLIEEEICERLVPNWEMSKEKYLAMEDVDRILSYQIDLENKSEGQ